MSDPVGSHDLYDYLFKFLVIGSAGTGKSCLLHQFIEGRFKEDSSHTIGVEFGSKIVPVGGKTVKLQVCHLLLATTSLHQCLMLTLVSLPDMGHSGAGTFSVGDSKLLPRSSRSAARVRHHLQRNVQLSGKLADGR